MQQYWIPLRILVGSKIRGFPGSARVYQPPHSCDTHYEFSINTLLSTQACLQTRGKGELGHLSNLLGNSSRDACIFLFPFHYVWNLWYPFPLLLQHVELTTFLRKRDSKRSSELQSWSGMSDLGFFSNVSFEKRPWTYSFLIPISILTSEKYMSKYTTFNITSYFSSLKISRNDEKIDYIWMGFQN